MYIHGKFINEVNDIITVHIVTNNDRTKEIEIGIENVLFADDPVEISNEVNDTFDHLLRSSAKIRLLCREYIPEFFCSSCRDAIVNVYQGERCVFAGFIEPQTFSQSFVQYLDEIELNCIDVLSALQYSKYKNIGSLGVIYAIVKNEAQQRSIYDIIMEILDGITSTLDILGTGAVSFLYDGSKAIDSKAGNRYSILSQLSISELLFLGDEEDDVWQQDAVMEECIKYLNLHIAQDGFKFYLFSWETVKSGEAIVWYDLKKKKANAAESYRIVDFSNANVYGTDTTISIGDVYNQLLLTCKIEDVDSIIESPLDDDLLVSPYANMQKYCTEYAADGEGKSAYKAFYAMTHEDNTDFGAGSVTNWFLQVMRNSQWSFPVGSLGSTDLISKYASDGLNQQALPNYLANHLGGAIFSMGKIKIESAKDDNAPVSKVDMSNYLVISVNGNGIDNDESKTYPSEMAIKAKIPYAVYTGNKVGGVFSPSDNETTNYIVLSGKVILNPTMKMTNTYFTLNTKEWAQPIEIGKPNTVYVWHQTVPSRNNGDGRYYTRKYWKAERPNTEEIYDPNTQYGFIPYSGEGPQEYEYKYSAYGESSDKISKVAVLACMLIIGGKCVVEKTPDNDLGTGVPYTGNGWPQDFVWRDYKPRESCASDEEYYQQCFNIGFDPKIGDKLIGTEYSLQGNHDYKIGIDAEGIAIPIKKADKVSGRVQFMILGPVNTVWGEITRRHPSFWRHTKWGTNQIPLLAHVSSIMLKSFEVKVYSDNGLINNNNDDNDVIYMSDTKESFVNRKDDLEFKISSALTSSECQKLGVSNGVKLSTLLNNQTGDGILSIYDYNAKVQDKAEHLYVDSYYREYHKPRVLMVQSIKDDGSIDLFTHYRHLAMNREFYIQGIGRNLMEGSAELTIKEIGND